MLLLIAGGLLAVWRLAPPSEVEVWAEIQFASQRADLDSRFVLAVCFAESSYKAYADSGYARGLMQISEIAWRQVRPSRPYFLAWDWRENIRAGVDYLVWVREQLIRHEAFSYPVLAAAYRYGFARLEKTDFDLSTIPTPSNDTYRLIFAGEVNPVIPPQP